MTRRWFLLLLFLSGLALAGARAQEGESGQTDRATEVEQLAARWQPSEDDWETEVLHEHVKHQLGELLRNLTEGGPSSLERASSFFTPDCRLAAPSLSSALRTVRNGGSILVRRLLTGEDIPTEEARTPTAFMEELVAPYRGRSSPRAESKVFQISSPEKGRFRSRAYLQLFGQTAQGLLQRNAEWEMTWILGEDPEHPLIEDLKVLAFHEVQAHAPLLQDCTGAAIGADPSFATQIQRGCDYWHGRIDAVGELTLFGHNGLAVADVNGDGREDLYVGMPTGIPNKLYLQQPDGTTREAAAASGVDWLDDTKGVLLADHDNDGDADLFLAMGPSIVLCTNDGHGRFSPARALRAGTDAPFYSLAAADYDGDGDLDLYAVRYVKVRYGVSVPVPFHDANNGPPNHLLRNDGDRGFTDVTDQVGLGVNNSRFSLAASWCDYDDDGDPDLYVANDFGRNNLYRNDHGSFTDVAASSGAEDQAAGMGVSWSDYDLDGDFDLYVSNMFSSAGQRIAYQPRFQAALDEGERRDIRRHSLGNSLLQNQGDGTFRDVSDLAGVRVGRWAWGSEFADLDGDGYDDLVVPNGFLTNEYKDDL